MKAREASEMEGVRRIPNLGSKGDALSQQACAQRRLVRAKV